jgi:hypothetical protein
MRVLRNGGPGRKIESMKTTTKWTVTFTAGKVSRAYEMEGSKRQARAWARRERHYFVRGDVARYKVAAAAEVSK